MRSILIAPWALCADSGDCLPFGLVTVVVRNSVAPQNLFHKNRRHPLMHRIDSDSVALPESPLFLAHLSAAIANSSRVIHRTPAMDPKDHLNHLLYPLMIVAVVETLRT